MGKEGQTGTEGGAWLQGRQPERGQRTPSPREAASSLGRHRPKGGIAEAGGCGWFALPEGKSLARPNRQAGALEPPTSARRRAPGAAPQLQGM